MKRPTHRRHLRSLGPDSLNRRFMPKAGKDILCGVHIAVVVCPAFAAYPLPYSKVGPTFRTAIGNDPAARTRLGCETLIHFFVPRAIRNRLVREHSSEGTPACIVDGLRYAGFSESLAVHVANSDVIKLPSNAGRELVQMVRPGVFDTGVDVCGLPPLTSPLSAPKRFLKLNEVAWIADDLTGRKYSQIFEPQVDTDAGVERARLSVLHFDGDIQEPVTPRVLRKTAAVFNLAFWQRSGIEDAECISAESKGIPIALQIAARNRHPAEGLFSAPTEKRSFELLSAFCVLLASLCDRICKQPEFFATARRQVVKVKSARPLLTPLQSLLLHIVAVVPDVINRTGLRIEQPVQRFDAVSIDLNHEAILT